MSKQTGKCTKCSVKLVKADGRGMKCPNYFNCAKYDIVTNKSIIEDLEKENEALKDAINNILDSRDRLTGLTCTWDLITFMEELEGGQG